MKGNITNEARKHNQRSKPQTRSNAKSVDKATDIKLIAHLLSNDSFQGSSFLLHRGDIIVNGPQEQKKLKNRLRRLRDLQRDKPIEFNQLQLAHGIKKKQAPSEFCQDTQEEEHLQDTQEDQDKDEYSVQEGGDKEKFETPRKMRFDSDATKFGNEVGNKIIVKTKKGIYLVMVWVDSKLDPGILEIKVDESGRRVIRRFKKPSATTLAKDLLLEMGSSYQWASDEDNAIVTDLQAELEEIQKQREDTRDDGWVEEVLCELDEEVVKDIVDRKGRPTNNVDFKRDECGRQRICFFLKAVRSNAKASPVTFTSSDVPAGVRSSSDDDSAMTYDDETVGSRVDDVRQEMNGRFTKMASDIMDSNAQMSKQLNDQMVGMMGQFMTNLTHQLKHQEPQPDQPRSDGLEDL
jgi:hypothetical protein